MKNIKTIPALIFTALFFPSIHLLAAPSTNSDLESSTLKVYVKPIAPFVFEKNNQLEGYSIDLWDRVAKECHFKFEYQQLKTVGEVIEGLKNKKADVGIAAISLTEEREQIIDFSHGYYTSGLHVMVPSKMNSSFTMITMIKSLMNSNFFMMLGLFLIGLILVAHALWILERKNNPDYFPIGYIKGIAESLWWTLCTVIAGGCDNKAPIGFRGRLVALFWMISGVLLVSYITASVTTSMTIMQLTGDIAGPDDLLGRKVATVKDSTAEMYLNERKIETQTFPTVEQAIKTMNSNKAEAVVYDAPVLLYYAASTGGKSGKVVGPLFRKQDYGIGLQEGSRYRKKINRTLLRLREQGFFDELQRKWFESNS